MKLQSRWSFGVVILVLSLIMILPLNTLAQEALTETFTSADNTFTFNYPAGWLTDASMNPGVTLANSQAAIDMLMNSDQPAFTPGMMVMLLVPSVTEYPYFPYIPSDATATDVANVLWDSVAGSSAPDDLVSNGAAATTIGGRSGVQVDGGSKAENLEIMVLIIDNGDSLSALVAITAFGEIAPLKPTVLAVAESMSYTVSSGQAETGTASLTTPGMIAYGDTVEANLTTTDGDRWTFEGSQGDVVQISLTSNFDNYLEVYDKQNTLLASDDDSGGNSNALIEEFAVPLDGTYTIVARGFYGETGSYTLHIELARTITFSLPGKLAYGNTVQANLTIQDGDRWTFIGTQGDIVSIRMTSTFDNYLELLDPSNTTIASDDDSGGNTNAYIAGFTLPADGMYTIVARTYSSDVGFYVLELIQPEVIVRGQIEQGQAVQGTLVDAPGERWTFSGQSGERVTIAAMSGIDTVLELYDANGQILSDTIDVYTSWYALIDSVILPSDGEYTVVVRPRYASDSNNYTLMLGHPAE